MSFYRSDTVNQYKFILPRESAWEIMNVLGQTSLIHVIPTKILAAQKPFISQVKRCEESLQKIINLERILQEKMILNSFQVLTKQKCKQLFSLWHEYSIKNQKHSISILDDIDREVQNSFAYYSDLNKRIQSLTKKLSFYRESMAIIRAGEQQFGRNVFEGNLVNDFAIANHIEGENRINFKAGILRQEEELRMTRTVFRISKGNSLTLFFPFSEIFQSVTSSESDKVVFFVLYPGNKNNPLSKKLDRICQAYNDGNHDLPTKQSEVEAKIRSLQKSYVQVENLLHLTENQLLEFLNKLAQNEAETIPFKKVDYLKFFLMKERQIYLQLNQTQVYNNFLKADIYVRRNDAEELQKYLTQMETKFHLPAGQLIFEGSSELPTYFVSNAFTSSAQEIVQTYGIPRYKQANPSIFTLVSFPFLFGVMFGDIGHGLILMCFGLYLMWGKHRIKNQFIRMLIPHRYLVTLMGFFATYCGFIYNDFMSISLNIFHSCYDVENAIPNQPIARFSEECVYGFGVDPVWAVASDNLNYINSLKMKISVIIAVVHMTLGVLVKASNTLYFRKYVDFFFEFLPQLTFMLVLFAYMDFLVVYKWLQPWESSQFAPSIITTMINIGLKLGKTENCCGGEPLFPHQDQIQLIILILAVISIPIMLLPKPLYLIYCKKKQSQFDLEESNDQELLEIPQFDKKSADSEQEEQTSSEIFVHQLIETIEYVLGCISNTASYLRLWALSLAHSQLSEVFFEKTVQPAIIRGYLGIPLMVMGFLFLAAATFGVLLCMDSMECFLHTLRLHWVEFQNKFYKGDGFLFIPFSFQTTFKNFKQ